MGYRLIWYIDEEVDEECIKYLEDKWSVKFPREYVELVKKHNGSGIEFIEDEKKLMDSKIKINAHKESEFNLLGYSKLDEIEKSHIINAYKNYVECLPDSKKILPFGRDGGGNLFFFDYRNDEKEPSILFLNHEESIGPDDICEEDLEIKPLAQWQEETLQFVADSFHEMLQKIEPDDYLNQVE